MRNAVVMFTLASLFVLLGAASTAQAGPAGVVKQSGRPS